MFVSAPVSKRLARPETEGSPEPPWQWWHPTNLSICVSWVGSRDGSIYRNYRDIRQHQWPEKALAERKPPPCRHLDFQSRGHSILHMPFSIGGPLESSPCLERFLRYLHQGDDFDLLGPRDAIRHMTIWYPGAISYRCSIVTEPLSPTVYKIFDLTHVHEHMNQPTNTTDCNTSSRD